MGEKELKGTHLEIDPRVIHPAGATRCRDHANYACIVRPSDHSMWVNEIKSLVNHSLYTY